MAKMTKIEALDKNGDDRIQFEGDTDHILQVVVVFLMNLKNNFF